ncbi:hypothetical protein PMAYCL1PPCAC_27761, partial [Pristionchus mayeri]
APEYLAASMIHMITSTILQISSIISKMRKMRMPSGLFKMTTTRPTIAQIKAPIPGPHSCDALLATTMVHPRIISSRVTPTWMPDIMIASRRAPILRVTARVERRRRRD